MKKGVSSGQLKRLVLNGYKSIQSCDIKLSRLNVLIGANGAGKSNLIGFFRLVSRVLDSELQSAVGVAGGPDAILHFGRKRTPALSAQLYFGSNGYKFQLAPTNDNRMMFASEALWWDGHGDVRPAKGHFETYVEQAKGLTQVYGYVVPVMRAWRIFHFHDTGSSAAVKQIHNINDDAFLRGDASNLGAFLFRLKVHEPESYQQIVSTIKLVAPFFGDFHLRPTTDNKEKIQLEWTEKGQDVPFSASALSDGTLRFICLATVLLQPEAIAPKTILIDEPELGLHPYAVAVLGGLIKAAAMRQQLIVSTQSVQLVNEFDAEDLIVVDKKDGASSFIRVNEMDLTEWLTEYSLGEIWAKNLIGGRPD
jgi:predicted ATPase